MSLSPLRKLLQGLASMIGVLFTLVGIILFLSGFNAYVNPDAPDAQPFEQILLAVGFLGLPASGMLFYKAKKSFLRGVNRYGLPDAPGRSLMLATMTITAAVLTCGAFVIVLTVF
ncbi:MAG: hypothetical protein IH600_14840 [Bacteroidetes bacterium]|nr:hypothetical protein [Bacteroidota bacterium]